MRKLIIAIAAVFLIPCFCFSQEVIVAKKKASGACNTASTYCIGITGSEENLSPNYYYVATAFTMGETATVCSIDLEFKKGVTPTGTYKAGIYSNNSGEPGTLIGSWSDNRTVSDLTTSYAYTNMTKTGGLGAALTASTLYWIVVYASGYLQDNLFVYNYTDCLVGSNYIKRSDDATTWNNGGQTTAMHYKLYK